MKENMNKTAERSIESIIEQTGCSRKVMLREAGQKLFIAGICTMALTIIVPIVNITTVSLYAHLLWLLLPIVIWKTLRKANNRKAQATENIIGAQILKIWWTFAAFTIGFCVLAYLWNYTMFRMCSPQESAMAQIRISPAILLLIGMTISITGQILKKHWLIWFGIIAGLLIAFVDYTGLYSRIFIYIFPSMKFFAIWQSFINPYPSVFLFAIVGLILPGWILKKQK